MFICSYIPFIFDSLSVSIAFLFDCITTESLITNEGFGYLDYLFVSLCFLGSRFFFGLKALSWSFFLSLLDVDFIGGSTIVDVSPVGISSSSAVSRGTAFPSPVSVSVAS